MWDSVGVDCHMGQHCHKEHQQTARKMSAQEKARRIMKNNLDKFAKRKSRCGVLWSFNSLGKKPVFTQSMSNLSMPWLLFNRAPNLNFHTQAAQRRHQRGGLFEAHAAHQSQEQQPYLAWVVPGPKPILHSQALQRMCLGLRFCLFFEDRTSSLSDPPCREKEQEMTGSYSKKFFFCSVGAKPRSQQKKHLYCGLQCLSRLCFFAWTSRNSAWNILKLRRLPHPLGCPTVCVASSRTRIASWSTSSMVSLTILPWHLDFATSQTMSKHTRGLWVFSKGSKSNSSRVQSPCFVQHVDNFLSKNPRPAESQSSHANISASASQICQKNKENAAWNPMLSNAPPGHPNVLTFSSPSSQHLALRFQEDIPWSSSTLKHLWHQTAPPHQQYLLQSVRILHVSCQNGKDGRGTERWKDGTQPHAHSGDGTSDSQAAGKVIHAKRQVSLTDVTENDAKKGERFRFNRCLQSTKANATTWDSDHPQAHQLVPSLFKFKTAQSCQNHAANPKQLQGTYCCSNSCCLSSNCSCLKINDQDISCSCRNSSSIFAVKASLLSLKLILAYPSNQSWCDQWGLKMQNSEEFKDAPFDPITAHNFQNKNPKAHGFYIITPETEFSLWEPLALGTCFEYSNTLGSRQQGHQWQPWVSHLLLLP